MPDSLYRRSLRSAVALALAMTISAHSEGAELPPPAGMQVDFVKHIQPVFEKHCYSCHGEKQQKADLRLDIKQLAFQGGVHGPVFIPGKSAESRLIQLVAGLDPDLVMPQKGDRLSPHEIGILRGWIDQGAAWPDGVDKAKFEDPRNHWAFKPPARPILPKVKQASWTQNPIDAFVLARLEKERLRPSPAADKTTLLRRLSLDLTGLPPTIQEIDEFLADASPDAYEKQVERLLASPHYGEKWGRHWLDAARYADSNGYEKDLARSIWPYRDWVIGAFNRDLPFDQFTIEQIAGDLLPNPTTDQRVATGFLRNSMLNEEGGIDPEQFRLEGIVDRMDTIGKAFLGLTIACAQCHNHKYDPISQKEYYQLFAFLNNDEEPEMEVPNAGQLKQRAAIQKKIAGLEDELLAAHPDIPEKMDQWEQQMRELDVPWTVLEPEAYYGAVGTKFVKLKDHSLLAMGSSPPVSGYTINTRTTLTNITGFRVEALTDPNLPSYGPGRADNGNFVLTEFTVFATPVNDPGVTNQILLTNATADFSQAGFPVGAAIDGDTTNKIGWAGEDLPGKRNRDRRAVFQTVESAGYEEGTLFSFDVKQLFGKAHTIGRIRLSVTAAEGPLQADPLTKEQRAILAVAPGQRTKAQQRELFSAYRITDERFAEINRKIDEDQKKWPAAAKTLVLLEKEAPRETRIFKRGDFNRPGDPVSAGVPAVLHPLKESPNPNRLTFAEWLVDKRNPLTARVIVNRLWQHYFGDGLLTTPEDFGTRAEPPSHPELLDWLAVEFMEPEAPKRFQQRLSFEENQSLVASAATKPWSLKHIHRLIVTSATYRQSSKVPPHLYERDPYNRLLARGPRLRVEAEAIRDIALSASGLLSKKIGGPSVFPPLPEGVMSLAYSPMKWETSTGEDRYRRAMYTFAKRTVPYPSLLTFDATSGEFSCVRRTRSNTPLQALTTLNDTIFHEAAQALALRVYNEGGSDDRARAVYAFRLCTGRQPDPLELKEMLALLEDQFRYFDERTATALTVALADPKSVPEDVNLHKVAAWTMVSRVLLNLDETITKE